MSAAFTPTDKFSRLYDHERELAAKRDAAPALYEALMHAKRCLEALAKERGCVFADSKIDAALNQARGQ